MLYKVGARSNAALSLAYIQTATRDFSNINCLQLVKYVSIELFTSYCTEEIFALSLSPSGIWQEIEFLVHYIAE